MLHNDMLEKMYTTKEAAPLLHLSHQETIRKCGKGLIKSHKPGRSHLIPESAISDYLLGKKRRQKAESR